MKFSTLFLVGMFSANLCKNTCFSKKILVPIFVSTISNKMTYMPLVEELGKRGHNITVLSPIKPTKKMKNVHEILTLDADKIEQTFVADPFKMKEQNIHQHPFSNIEWYTRVCRETYDLPQVRSLMEESFDLILIQPMLNECALGLVYRINAPMVFFSPISAPKFLADRVGCHFPSSFTPNLYSVFTTEMNFYERFINYSYDLWLKAYITYFFQPAMQAVYEEKVGKDVPSVDEMMNNVSLILSNGHFILHGAKPFLPDIVDVGTLKCHPPNALSKTLENFINKGKEGFIYFSMGSAIKGHTMSEEKRRLFLNVFAKLKQQVIWKWETETMPDIPSNVILSKFLPQQDLLGHKDIKLFISHCGGGSTEEAVYHAVPVIALPIFGDQLLNANLAKLHGYVIELDWNKLSEKQLLAAIKEILSNPRYQKNVQKISTIYRDQPKSAMERAVYWVEYIIRHKGATHLRSPGRKLNYFQYHSIDVMITYFAIIVTILFIIYKLISCTLRTIIRHSFSKNIVGIRKKNL